MATWPTVSHSQFYDLSCPLATVYKCVTKGHSWLLPVHGYLQPVFADSVSTCRALALLPTSTAVWHLGTSGMTSSDAPIPAPQSHHHHPPHQTSSIHADLILLMAELEFPG